MNTTQNFPSNIRQAWVQSLLANGRFKTGVKGSGKSERELLKSLIRKEMNTVEHLWDSFTKDRGGLQKSMLSTKQYAMAYAIAFQLPNIERLLHAFRRIDLEWDLGNLFRLEQQRVVDLGAGTGAMSLAMHEVLKENKVESSSYTLYDSSKAALELAKDMLSRIEDENKIRIQRTTMESLRYTPRSNPNGLDIYLFGYLWNELFKNNPARRKIMNLLKGVIEVDSHSIVVAVEPALEKQARDAMSLREFMISQGYHVLYPCPHSQSCPMLLHPVDRCYSEFKWAKPEEQKYIDSLLGVERNVLAASVYVFASPKAMEKLEPRSQSRLSKVVGRPSKKDDPKKFDYLACGADLEIKKVPPKGGYKNRILRGQEMDS